MVLKKDWTVKELSNEFDVRDALGGNLTGDYSAQKKELEAKKMTMGRRVYELACQMQEQH